MFHQLSSNLFIQFYKGFSNRLVNAHIHRNPLLDNKRVITGLRWCVYPKYILFRMKLLTSCRPFKTRKNIFLEHKTDNTYMQIICTDIIWPNRSFVVLFTTVKLQVHILRKPILFETYSDSRHSNRQVDSCMMQYYVSI